MAAAKTQLIREIEAIYRDHNYRPKGRPLAAYSEEQLRAHLAKLQAGAHGWMQGKAFREKEHRRDACVTK
jgi:hypothetical protein